jgi:hypothetical protein
VHVGVDESGGQIASFQVDDFGGVMIAEPDDRAVFYGDAALDDAPGKDVDDSGVGQQQVGRRIAAGGGDDGFQVHGFRISCAMLLTRSMILRMSMASSRRS